MSTQQQPQQSPSDLARAYIDDVMRINGRHGAAGHLSEDTYNAAVAQAEQAFRGLHAHRGDSRTPN